jgi:hypothetical protein
MRPPVAALLYASSRGGRETQSLWTLESKAYLRANQSLLESRLHRKNNERLAFVSGHPMT